MGLLELLIARFGVQYAYDILASQFIDPDAINAIQNDAPEKFFTLRANALFASAVRLTKLE